MRASEMFRQGMSAKSPSLSTADASMSVAEVGDWREGAAGAILGVGFWIERRKGGGLGLDWRGSGAIAPVMI
jgi:hypothetical protein